MLLPILAAAVATLVAGAYFGGGVRRAVRGIGPHSVRALELAAREYARTARAIAPQLPQPELGKTIEALAAAVHVDRKREYCATLVVAPASILANWMHEIAGRTPLPGHLLHGDDFDEALAAWARRGGVGVTSYSTLRRNQEDVLKELPARIDKAEWVDLGPDEFAAYADHVDAGNFMGIRRAVSERGAKLERLEDLLDEYRASGIKVLLFSYFLAVLDAVEHEFEICGRITGSVDPRDRFALVQAFTEAEGHRLLARRSVDERLVEMLREKQDLFERFARESRIKEASEEATATGPARAIIEAERARLGGN